MATATKAKPAAKKPAAVTPKADPPVSAPPSNIHMAMLLAQRKFEVIHKDQQGQQGNRKYSYADFVSIMTHVLPILNAVDVWVSQPTRMEGPVTYVETILTHAPSETSISSQYYVGSFNDARDRGTDITYAKRYALSAILGLVTDEDKDGSGTREMPPPPMSGLAEDYIIQFDRAKSRLEAKKLFVQFKSINPIEADYFPVKAAANRAWKELKGTQENEEDEGDQSHDVNPEDEVQEHDHNLPSRDENPEELLAEIETTLEQASDIRDVEDAWAKYEPAIGRMVADSDRETCADMFLAKREEFHDPDPAGPDSGDGYEGDGGR